MQPFFRFILSLVLLTAFADLAPAVQDFFEPHAQISSPPISSLDHSVESLSAPDLGAGHHHDGPCVGGHCHLGHCAFLVLQLPIVRFGAGAVHYDIRESQIPASPFLDTMKRPPRA